ncbi:MAG: asparagine synthase C-terminal domain-containing protein [Candidatus Helarchaeota archaeon]
MVQDLAKLSSKLRELLDHAVKKNLSKGILLSGGLDTSIIAKIASKYKKLISITIRFKNVPAPDVNYAVSIAQNLGFEHYVHTFDITELYKILPKTIRILKSFDPMEIRNSVVIHIGLSVAKKKGITTILTGDGADELFAGYSYLFDFKGNQLNLEMKKLASIMTFSSTSLAKELGMVAKLPYLEQNVKDFALQIDPIYKIRENNGIKYGKWILRKAYEKILPDSIIWRVKTPIEIGSGTSTLPNFFNHEISDAKFQEKKKLYQEKDAVRIRDKEQLYYYEIFRSVIGVPSPTIDAAKVCPQCNSSVLKKATYCRTCGAYPI